MLSVVMLSVVMLSVVVPNVVMLSVAPEFVHDKHFQHGLIFASKAEAYLCGLFLVLPSTIIRLGRNVLPEIKILVPYSKHSIFFVTYESAE
jgi:hypothetical protein